MKLIDKGFDLSEINILGVKEAGYKVGKGAVVYPRIHNMHTWFARRPAGIARVLTAAALLPSEIDEEEFQFIIGLDRVRSGKKLIVMARPHTKVMTKYIDPSKITVMDPMAGGGSIPLEAARLGLNTIAVDYNFVAYLILKGTVEFPAKFGKRLFELAYKEAKDFIQKADAELGRFYGDSDNYLIARGIECPNCSGHIPVSGVFPAITKNEKYKKRFLKIIFDKNKGTFKIKTTDLPQTWKLKKIRKKADIFAECPYCTYVFKLRGRGNDHAFARMFQEHAEIMKRIVEDLEPVTPELEERLLKIHIPLCKLVKKEFFTIYDDEEERERFLDAYRELSKRIFELQSYIPMDDIPDENQWAQTARNLGLTKWYMLFNPRQLLIIAELAKMISERAAELYDEKGEIGAAAMLYLAFALDKLVDYNTLATKWQGSRFKTGIGNTLRGESTLDFRSEYAEAKHVKKALEWTLEPKKAKERKFSSTRGGILPVLRFLTDQFEGQDAGKRLKVYLGDSTQLIEFIEENSIDIINVDPPYYEQVIYSDKSEIFWVIIRRSLKPILPILFKNSRFKKKVYELPTLMRSNEMVERKGKSSKIEKNGKKVKKFKSLFETFVDKTYRVLKDTGYLILWFTHPKAEAWNTIGKSLYETNYLIPKIYPINTEMPTRYKKQVNRVAQQITLAIIAKKGDRKLLVGVKSDKVQESLLNHEDFLNAVKDSVDDARNIIKNLDITTADAAAILFSTAMGVVSRFKLPFKIEFNQLYTPAITLSILNFFSPVLEKIFSKRGNITLMQEEASILSRKIEKSLLLDEASRSFISLWMISHVKVDGSLYETPLDLSYDFTQMVSKLCGFDHIKLSRAGLIKKDRSIYKLSYLLDYSTGRIKTNIVTFLETSVGRSIYLTYLAATTGGTPAVRAKQILENENLLEYSDELQFDASLALALLATSPDSALDGLLKIEIVQLRKIIAESLAHLVIGDVRVEVKTKRKAKTKTIEDYI